TDRYGNVHVRIGKASFSEADLESNLRAVLDELLRVKPAAAKGRYMKKISLSTTIGPCVKVDVNRLKAATE
ncbi:MAG: 50S ribosomal protein L1, partial [Actinomycetota bacterium]